MAIGLTLVLTAPAVCASSLRFCQNTGEPSAAAQDRLIQVASIVKDTLERSDSSVALVARSGLSLHWLGQRYSHAGFALRNSTNAPWSVRQLYYACDEARPGIFDQGMTGFVLGTNDPKVGYLTMVFMPQDAANAIAHRALNDRAATNLLGATYSANAFAFDTRYQNCNQWVAEMLASALGDMPADSTREHAQQWLQQQAYQPTALELGWRPLLWLAATLPWLHTDDHPDQDLERARFRVSMPQSLERFLQVRFPGSKRLEFCYTERQVVVHEGWDAMPEGCEPLGSDTVISLTP